MRKGWGFVFCAGLLVLSGFVLAACSSTPKGTAANVQDDALICTRERPTGSHVSVRNCRTRAQIEQEREAAREAMEEVGRIQSTATPDT